MSKKPAADISAACYAWILGAKLEEARYRAFALDLYDRFLGEKVDHDFHASRPFGLLTWKLHRAGALTGARRERARQQARERIDWFLDARRMDEELFDCNIALADTLAVACLARAFADDPAMRVAEVQRAVAVLGKRIMEAGDLNENASNYASLGICFFLELAELEGWMDAVREADHFRNMFARMRDIISPAGSIPEYGDGYFRHRETRLDFLLLLEVAARLYSDASFQAAARKLMPDAPMEVDEDQLHRGYMLLELEPCQARGESSAVPSVVQYRRVPGSPIRSVSDKMILRAGSGPGDAMIMMDLYALGSHAHEYKRPSIGYYEVDGVPLFHNIGRRGTRSGQCGNSFWIFDRPDAFPGYPKTNAWNTMTVQAEYCFPEAEEGAYQIGQSLLLRNFRTPGLKFLRFDNLRLDGPRGSLLLDGFESSKTWHGNVSRHPKVKLESSQDHTQGEFSQQVNWSIFGEQYCTRLLEQEKLRGTTFRSTDYDSVKLDYRFEGQHPHCNLRDLFKRWIDLGDRPLHCDVVRADTGHAGGDAWGNVRFASYMGPGNTLERRIVLTREGVLVIVDTFTAGPAVGGCAGGQLWQLYALKERGEDWFASESDGAYALSGGSTEERRMLVKFMKGPGLTIASERVRPSAMHAPKADGTQHREFITAYSKGTLSPGRTTVSAMAVLPLPSAEDAAQRARGVAFEARPGAGVSVTIDSAIPGQRMIVDFTKDAAVVRRQAIEANSGKANK